MNVQSYKLTNEVKDVVLGAGAVVAGIGAVGRLLGRSRPESIYSVSFGLKFPDQEIDELPDDRKLMEVASCLSMHTQGIYQQVQRVLETHHPHVCVARFDAAIPVFGVRSLDYTQKALAVLSGLGWIGKSSLLINRQYGPRLRLGTLLTDASLVADRPETQNRCSGCLNCQKACPAQAVAGRSEQWDRYKVYRVNHEKCQQHLARNISIKGRKDFCGLCMKACPYGKNPQQAIVAA